MRAFVTGLAVLCIMVGLDVPHALGPAYGAPVVKVRSRTQIVMEPVRRRSEGVEVRGRVTDPFSGEPVTGADVEVRMSSRVQTARTDMDGDFAVFFDVADGRYDVTVRYEGGEYHSESAFELGGVDISKQSLELSVRASDVAYSKRTVEVTVKAMSGQEGVAITAELYAGSATGRLVPVGRVTTDPGGHGVVNINREVLGDPGRKRVQARFLGNRAFNPGEAQSDFLLTTGTETEFSVDVASVAYEATLSGTGRVVNGRGQGIARAPVALVAGARRLAQTLTDDSGAFRLRVSGSEIGAGRFNVQAVFEPSEPWQRGSRSELRQIEVAEPQPVPVAYTVAAFGTTALALAAFLGLRAKPWQTWLARRKARATGPGASSEDGEPAAPAISHGLKPARPSLVSTLRRPHEFDFSGTVRDAVKGSPVPGCLVVLTHVQAGKRDQRTDGEGQFKLTGLDAGEWEACASAPGYVSEWFPVTMPHRGELSGVHIDLVPVRERVFAMYREVAQPLLPGADLWGIWTPRQIFGHVRAERPASALSELTDFVEETYFSQRTPDEEVLPATRELVDRAQVEVHSPLS